MAKGSTGQQKKRAWGIPFVGVVAALCLGRLSLVVADAVDDPARVLDVVMTTFFLGVIAAGAVFVYRFYQRELKGWVYDPPLGKSPSMPGYFEDYYEGHKLQFNAFGEIVHAESDEHKGTVARGGAAKAEHAEGEKTATEEKPAAPKATPTAPRTPTKKRAGKKRKVLAAPRAGQSVDTEVEVGPRLGADGTLPTPQEIYDAMGAYVIGQEDARRTLAVAVYNHYKRVTPDATSVNAPDLGVEISKSNVLLLGPTGSGKTLMVQTLARILDVPLAIADATTLTETGYVGEDVEQILARLIAAAGNVESASLGIVYIDEVDKIARHVGTGSFVARGDPAGEGVQQGLLKLLEGSDISVPPLGGRTNLFQRDRQLDTTNILFICGGAFVGLTEVVRRRIGSRSIGFAAPGSSMDELTDEQLLAMVEPQDLHRFGLIPELVGRIPIITHTNELKAEDLVRILTEPRNAIVRQFQQLLAYDGVELVFDDEALTAIAEAALGRGTGARGLRSICENVLRDAMFEVPGRKDVARVVVHKECVTDGEKPEYVLG